MTLKKHWHRLIEANHQRKYFVGGFEVQVSKHKLGLSVRHSEFIANATAIKNRPITAMKQADGQRALGLATYRLNVSSII